MAFFRIKHSFTAGELSPLMHDRIDFERFKNGCKTLKNMFCATQGPAVRRPGFKFVYDLSRLDLDPANPQVRMIPFIFSELQSYVMIFYRHTDGSVKCVFGTTNSKGEDGLVLGTGTVCTYSVYPTPTAAVEGPYTHPSIHPETVSVAESRVAAGQVVTVDLPAGWDIENFDYAQSADEMYFAQAGLPPHIIKRFDNECWQLSSVTFTDQPADWSDVNGWPERVVFHQQRLVFASNTLRRQTVWCTKAGDFSSFGISSPLKDDDAVTFTLDSSTQNKIQWLSSGKSLYIGTLGDEWTVEGNDRTALTPSNINARRQTNNGSESIKPLKVGITTLFVERHGRVINEFVYDYTYDSYKTSDMAVLSPHLMEFYSVIDWAYQQTPDSIIWSVREDGTLLGITYQRQHKVVGWHQHDTMGEFKAISAIPGQTREDDVWVTVKRSVNGQDRYFVEKLEDWFKSDTSPISSRFLDAHTYHTDSKPFDTLQADHLVGRTVDILADGTVHPPRLVQSDGTVKLNKKYSKVVIGLPYESELRPHVMEADAPGGVSRGRTQRITNIKVDLYRSLGMYIGRHDQEDGDIEEEVPFRVPGDLLGRHVPLFTGWYHLPFPAGFDREAEYFIKQKQPLPLTVRCVVDEVEVNE